MWLKVLILGFILFTQRKRLQEKIRRVSLFKVYQVIQICESISCFACLIHKFIVYFNIEGRSERARHKKTKASCVGRKELSCFYVLLKFPLDIYNILTKIISSFNLYFMRFFQQKIIPGSGRERYVSRGVVKISFSKVP